MKTKKQTLIETLQKLKGPADFILVAETTQEANKKSRVTKIVTPANLETITKFKLAKVRMGEDYEDSVNAQREKEGLSPDFKAGSTYCIPLNMIDTGVKAFISGMLAKIGIQFIPIFSRIIFKHKEHEQYYVRVYPNLCKEFLSESLFFDKDGNDITEKWSSIQAEYFKVPPKDSGRQGTEKSTLVNNYKLENVKYLGEGIINELTEDHLKLVEKLSK